eukprot:gnl/Dysnectes_brevis/526_a583_6085.p1 GENE.gnl/Dysnectes_brevis/526_a583_6085~~gnl/Dysnectes_brevis/526_a583_6085.p1  ORF type:complete len:396 (-),score=89.97 gnl/Dysnectes_brevis/526_a583_6085:86-1273(-)
MTALNVVKTFLFSSECVCEGHPDKLCDQISDGIVDAILSQDPNGRIAAEVGIKGNTCFLLGEITSTATVNYDTIVRHVLKHVGFDDVSKGCDYKTIAIVNHLTSQSPDIAQAVHEGIADESNFGAGDQGMMFGYATDETDERMPLSHLLATRLAKRLAEVRKEGGPMSYLRPDGKTQVTLKYQQMSDGSLNPIFAHTIVVSAQHSDSVTQEQLGRDLEQHVVNHVFSGRFEHLKTADTILHMNPSGRFVIGGPASDAGVTGRKIIVDTYGGWGAHGGGAFSGKDFTKVDRSASYAARWVARSLVDAGLCRRVLVQLSYAIGLKDPLAICVDSYGTGTVSDEELTEVIKRNFDLSPGMIARDLDLKRARYSETASYGHFGREGEAFDWERSRKLNK